MLILKFKSHKKKTESKSPFHTAQEITTTFTFPILPKHILEHASFEGYSLVFAANPITSWCGKLETHSKDSQSLAFNLLNCSGTNLAFYQIKNYPWFEALAQSVLEDGSTIVDSYTHQVQLPNYEKLKVIKSDVLTIFFNTKSPKMKVRLRRALGGLINSKFYLGEEYGKFLLMYKGELLNKFYSDGSNIAEFINRISPTESEESVQQQDLKDSGVQVLKKSISINGVERKFVFYTSQKEAKSTLEIKFSNQFETIKITDNKGHSFSPTKYKKTDKKVKYPLEKNKNPSRTESVYYRWIYQRKKYTIANIDLYLVSGWETHETTAPSWKLNVIYYNNLESNFAIKQLRKILEEANILENFLLNRLVVQKNLEGKIMQGDYDILLNTVNMGMKKKIFKKFWLLMKYSSILQNITILSSQISSNNTVKILKMPLKNKSMLSLLRICL